MSADPETLPIAAVVADDPRAADAAVRLLLQRLHLAGRRVSGLLQEAEGEDWQCQVWLQEIGGGRRYLITQNLGAGSASCRLDVSRLAEAGEVVRELNAGAVDLVVFNRFAGLEAKGQGFAAEMLALMAAGQPVLVIVPGKFQSAWRTFSGSSGVELPADADALHAWFASLPRRTS